MEKSFHFKRFPGADAGVSLGASATMGLLQPLPHGQVGNMGIHWAWERQDIKEPPLFPVSVKITATFKKKIVPSPHFAFATP